jgi:hypothetical protein
MEVEIGGCCITWTMTMLAHARMATGVIWQSRAMTELDYVCQRDDNRAFADVPASHT